MNKLKSNKAFTIVELIVVIAIIAILVLLGAPKIQGYVDKARLTRIQHDVRVMENKMEEVLIHSNNNFDNWGNNEKDLGMLILRNQLFEKEGLATRVNMKHLLRGNSRVANLNNKNTGMGGELYELGTGGEHEITPDSGYKIIPEKFKSRIGTKLDGTFYANELGKVYYEPNKPMRSIKQEQVLACVAAETLDYEFNASTGTIVKYNGTLQYITIPSAFEIDGECVPVRIIGPGAFMRGDFNFKKIIIPQSVNEIQEDAFRGNELEEIEIPHSVDTIGPNAFADNKLTEENVTIKNNSNDINVDVSSFSNNGSTGASNVSPTYKTPTASDLKIIFNKPAGRIEGSYGGFSSSSSSSGNYGSGGSGGQSEGGSSSNSSANNNYDKVIKIPSKISVGGEDYEVKEIAPGAFQGQGIIYVEFPNTLQRIEDYAFAGNQLIGVDIPDNIGYIGNYAFAFNELHDNKEAKWTIGYINFKQHEQINNVDKKIGSIVDSQGKKISELLGSNLLNYIWVNSNSNHVVSMGNKPVDNVSSISVPSLLYPGETHTIQWGSISDWGTESDAIKNKYKLEYRCGENDNYKLLAYVDKENTSYNNYIDVGKNITQIQYRIRAENLAGKTDWLESDIINVQKDSRFQSIGADTYVIPSDGVYHLAIGGAQGGKGGNYTPDIRPPKTYSGGSGGSGATIGGIFELKEGDVLNINIGRAGSDGKNGGRYTGNPSNGTSGGETSVYLNGIKLISARGGGGGPAAKSSSGTASAGSTGGGFGINYVSPIGTSSIEGVSISSGQFKIRLIDIVE